MPTNSMTRPSFSASPLSASSITFNTLRHFAGLTLALLMVVAFGVATPATARAEKPKEGIRADELRPFLGTWYLKDGDANDELYIGSVEVKQKGSSAEVKVEFDHWIANQSHKHGNAETSDVTFRDGKLTCTFGKREGAFQLSRNGYGRVFLGEDFYTPRPFRNQLSTGTYEMHDAAWAKAEKKNHPYVEGGFMKTMEVVSIVGMGMQAGMAQAASTTAANQAAVQQAEIQAQEQAALRAQQAAAQQAELQAQQQAALRAQQAAAQQAQLQAQQQAAAQQAQLQAQQAAQQAAALAAQQTQQQAGPAVGSSSTPNQPAQTPPQKTVPYTKCQPSENGAACGVE
jgi:hypothetical protein